jgi:cytosine/adenosine deaminase-related metal-dependent hydrolase
MSTERTLIRAGCVVTMDQSLGILSKGDLLLEDGKIVEVAPRIDAEAGEVVDASDTIALPGFVDTHRHVWQAAMRGVTADWSLTDYIRGIRFRAAGTYRPEDMYAAQYAGALEALDAGVTTIVDYSHNVLTPDHAREAIRGLREAGIRALWCYGFNDPPTATPFFEGALQRAELARELAVEQFSSKGDLLTLGIAPEEAGFLTPEIRELQFRTARELDARITQHVNPFRLGRDPLEAAELANHGLLGPDVLLVHMGYSTDDEWQRVADSGASVSFTPETELQMGMSFSPTALVRRFGIPPSIGADIVSNNSGDMFFQLRLALQAERAIANVAIVEGGTMPEGVTVTCQEALEWGTIHGARAAGLEHRIGSLSPGKEADIVLIRTDHINLAGWNGKDPVANVVLQAHPGNVDTVLVAGRLVKRSGRLLADVAKARALVTEAQRRVAHATEALGGFHASPDEIPIPVPEENAR